MAGQQGAGKTGGPFPSSPDPNFPDRPDHPDFHLLSALIQDLDRSATPNSIAEITFGKVDEDSLIYLIKQRLLRMEMLHGPLQPSMKARVMAVYMEAFTMGRQFAEAKKEEVKHDA